MLFKPIDEVTENFDVCNRYQKARSRPVVALPMDYDFNEMLAMDLKFITVGNRNIKKL